MSPQSPASPRLAARLRRFLAELDRREGYVSGHSVSVCETALQLGEALGLDVDELESVTLGALVHDIGKLFVDGRLLGKPAPLTPAEIETIRLHPQLGEALLAPSLSHETVLGIVRWHHERWDGAGYPDGLAGAATPLPARIVATADAFVAMGETRAYRASRGLDDALAELERESARQFDPGCVAALVDLFAVAGRREVA